MAKGLQYIHSKQLVHLDIKPANIMLIENEDGSWLVKIIDFGLSKLCEVENVATSFLGTRGYLAPEMLKRPAASVGSSTGVSRAALPRAQSPGRRPRPRRRLALPVWLRRQTPAPSRRRVRCSVTKAGRGDASRVGTGCWGGGRLALAHARHCRRPARCDAVRGVRGLRRETGRGCQGGVPRR